MADEKDLNDEYNESEPSGQTSEAVEEIAKRLGGSWKPKKLTMSLVQWTAGFDAYERY